MNPAQPGQFLEIIVRGFKEGTFLALTFTSLFDILNQGFGKVTIAHKS